MGRFSDQWKLVILVPQLGLTIVVSVLLSAYAGYWLDEYFQVRPFCTIVGAIVGFGGGVRAGWKLINRSLPRRQDGISKKGNKK